MNEIAPPDSPEGPDLIDRIANALPDNVRSDYYRELIHCRSLPQNDEMLRILRAMQFLTLLMIQAPADVAAEREKMQRLFGSALQKVHDNLASCLTYQKFLEERLVGIPDQIQKKLKIETIVASLNQDLRQQFAKSTIPETARALALVAESMRRTTAEFDNMAGDLTNSYRGVAEEAQKSIDGIESSVSKAGAAAKRAADNLSQTFHSVYWWFLAAAAISVLILGFACGMLYQHRLDAPLEQRTDSQQIVMPSPKLVHHTKQKP
jgi:methyl-accepting chemotaxis protein